MSSRTSVVSVQPIGTEIARGGLLVFAGAMGMTGLNKRLRFGRQTAWLAGVLSGAFGGLVGNQGGIRSAALLGFEIRKEAFVATATAIGVMVDVARLPVYLATQLQPILHAFPLLAMASGGIIVGTVLGEPLLRRIPDALFHRLVSAIIFALGAAMLMGVGR